jgi:threonine synthase
MNHRSFLTHLECSACGQSHDADVSQTVCRVCGKVLFARYDLVGARAVLRRDSLRDRPASLWRYSELLPVRDPAHVVTLGEGMTPLLQTPRLGAALGLDRLLIKEEGLNPTGSFKARGMAVAVSRARELGIRRVAAPSAGNAGAALAAYAARAGMTAYVFMPDDTPMMPLKETAIVGAHGYLVRGLINDAGKIVRGRDDWFDMSTLKEPYRAEGKKTMGFEVAEQLDWQLPDAIIYPTGGGTGLVGMWKAFAELEAMGWIGSARPRMYSVQASGCAPIVRAYERGADNAELWDGARTIASGLRVPIAIGDYLMLQAIRDSGGSALTVDDDDILATLGQVGRTEGLFVAPEGAAAVAGLRKLVASGQVRRDERVIVFNTGSGLVYPELVDADFPLLDPTDPEVAQRITVE